MGNNADIKHDDFHPPEERLTFFPTSASKAAVATQLLQARWLVRASALGTGATTLGKRYDEPIAVKWDADLRLPSLFFWRRRRWPVEELLSTWVVETYWWDESRRVSRSYWRVRAGGGVFDLYFDRITKCWFMGTAVD